MLENKAKSYGYRALESMVLIDTGSACAKSTVSTLDLLGDPHWSPLIGY